MNIHAPTVNSLNKGQKRALIIRDELRYQATPEIDTFIDGILPQEPPAYRYINGRVHPALVMVTLKESATRFDLGNIDVDKDIVLEPGIYHGYLTFENGRIDIRTEEALPINDDILDTVPMHLFVVKNMFALFDTKCRAIFARLRQVNDVRQAAYASVNKPQQRLHEDQALARRGDDRVAQDGSYPQAKPKMRRPGEAVSKHVSNKRARIGLETISEETKAATFNIIPSKIKVDLFDNIIKTALPDFDNLMLASWNVVSVYQNVGTDFPELHKSIVELKSVLQDFEEGMGKDVDRKEPTLRIDFATPSQDGASGSAGANGSAGAGGANGSGAANGRPSIQLGPGAVQGRVEDAAIAPQEDVEMTSPEQDRLEHLFSDPEPETTIPAAKQRAMPAPSADLMDMIRRHDDKGDVDSENDNEPEPTPRPPTIRTSLTRPSPAQEPTRSSSPRRLDRRSRPASTIPDPDLLRSLAKPKPTSSLPAAASSPPSSRASTPSSIKRPMSEISTADLKDSYKKRKADLLHTFRSHHNVPQHYRTQMQKMMAEIRSREEEEVVEVPRREGEVPGLGRSVLGAGKNRDGVPVANMVPGRKEGGGGVGAGVGGKR